MATSEDFKENLIEALKELIGGHQFQGGAGSYATSGKEFGNYIGRSVAPYLTGDPILQKLVAGIGGPMIGNIINANVPGASGGLNVNDSYFRQEMHRARQTMMDQARADIDRGFERSAANIDKGRFLFNVGARMSGISDIHRGFDPTNFGYVAMPLGRDSAFLTESQRAQNANLRQQLFTNDSGKKGFLQTITEQYGNNPYGFGGMNARDMSALGGDMAARGLLDLGGDDENYSGTIQKIQKAARSVKSIRDIIKGPLREVVAQMEQTFGSGYLNTFGTGGAAQLVNKMRAAASMSGFSTQQVMALAPSAKGLVEAVGGSSVNAANNATMTSLIMGLTRGKDKAFVDEGQLTSDVLKIVTGAQQSKMGKNIASARSLIEDPEKKKEFDAALRKRQAAGGEISTEFLAEISGSSVSTIITNRDNARTKREMNESNIGAQMALLDQKREIAATRRSLYESELGGADKVKALAEKNNMSVDELLFTNFDKIQGLSKGSRSSLENSFRVQAKMRDFKGYEYVNNAYRDIEEATKREQFSEQMGDLFTQTNYGSDMGVNLMESMRKKGGLKEIVKTMLNIDPKTGKPQSMLRNAGTQKDIEDFVTMLKKDAEDMGMTKEESAKYIEENVTTAAMHRGGIKGYKTAGEDGESLYFKRKFKSLAEKSMMLSEDKIEDAITKADQDRVDSGKAKMTVTEKQDMRRKLQAESFIEGGLSGAFNEAVLAGDQDRMDKLVKLKQGIEKDIKDGNFNNIDNRIRKNKDELKDHYSEKRMKEMDKSETTAMTRVIEEVLKTLPVIGDGVKEIAKVFKQIDGKEIINTFKSLSAVLNKLAKAVNWGSGLFGGGGEDDSLDTGG
jgi:hypothetical protein